MTSVKKSILIPLEKYNHLLNHGTNDQVSKAEQMSNSQILHTPQEVQSGHGNENQKDSKWLLGIPSLFKRNSQAILDHFLDHKDTLTWNERGEIIYKGHVIAGSNLTDLLKDSQRSYKHLNPLGDREFYRAWAELNMPEGLLGNEQRKAEVRNYKTNPNDQYIPPPPGIPQRSLPRKGKSPVSRTKWMTL